MNKNEFVKIITLKEKKKIQISIAQAKELLSIIIDELQKMSDEEIIKFIRGKKKK